MISRHTIQSALLFKAFMQIFAAEASNDNNAIKALNDNNPPLTIVPKIYLVQNHQKDYFAAMLDESQCRRYDVFIKQLKWDIPSINGREQDQYDTEKAINLISVKNGRVNGGIRMLPTEDGNYMLRKTFPYLLNNQHDKMPMSSKVWEATRLFSIKQMDDTDNHDFARLNTIQLLVGLYEFGLSWKITNILGVSYLHTETIFQKMGWDYSRLAEPQLVDGKPVVVVDLKISEDNFKTIQQNTGIYEPMVWTPLPFSVKKPEGFSKLAKSKELTKAAL